MNLHFKNDVYTREKDKSKELKTVLLGIDALVLARERLTEEVTVERSQIVEAIHNVVRKSII